MTRCPTCGQPIVKISGRICAQCEKPIARHDKYFFGEDSRIRHRDCKNPQGCGDTPPSPQTQLIKEASS